MKKTYLMLQNTMQKTMEEKLNLFIKKCQENNADLLGIRKSYYDKNRSNIGKYWTKENIEVNAKIEISKKGAIYEFK
jgi:low affinity Fe/Cu permease